MRPAASPTVDSSTDFGGLASAARRALGSEAILVVRESGDGAPVVADHAGLDAAMLAVLRRGLQAGDRGVLAREFTGVLSADVVLEGQRLGAIHALRHGDSDFERPELLAIFATQVAIAMGVASRVPGRYDGSEILSELDQLVLSVHDLEDLSHAVASALGPTFDGALTAVMVADPQRNLLQMSPGAFGADGAVAASHQVNLSDPSSNSARVFETGQPYISNCSVLDAGIRQDYVDIFGIRRLLTVPLRRVGVLHIANKPAPFTLDDLERALALAPRIASIVELAITLLRLRREQRLNSILADIAVAVASGSSIQDILVPALEELCAATHANILAIVPDAAAAIVARRGPAYPDHEADLLKEAQTNPGVRAYVVGPHRAGDPGHAVFYVPVRLGQQRVGTLAAFRARGEPFAQSERRSLTRMANLAALARATERYQQQRAELARMQERQRIADDLHDDVAQILFAAQLSLDAILRNDALDEDLAEAIIRARGLLIRGDTAIRTVIHRLSTPSTDDTASRLASVVSSVEEEFSLAVRLEVTDDASQQAQNLRRPISDALVKVARESLVNAAKHAGPCRLVLSLQVSRGNRLVLTVADNGRHVPSTDGAHHHGLASLRRVVEEHGGTLRVVHGASGGTRVTAGIPLETARA